MTPGISLLIPRDQYRRLSSWRTEERTLGQRSIYRVFELDNGNFEKFHADFEREADQNSKNKAVPRQKLQHKEAPNFRGRHSTSQGPSDDFVRRRTPDLTASIIRPRGERSSHAPMPCITAASAVFMAPVRIKAVRKAISSALGIVSKAIREILSDACRSKPRDAAERSTLASSSVSPNP